MCDLLSCEASEEGNCTTSDTPVNLQERISSSVNPVAQREMSMQYLP